MATSLIGAGLVSFVVGTACVMMTGIGPLQVREVVGWCAERAVITGCACIVCGFLVS